MIEDCNARVARLLAYAAMVCGGLLACLLLLAAPARADDGKAVDGGGLASLGDTTDRVTGASPRGVEQLGKTARSTVDETTDAVRHNTSEVPVAGDVAQRTGQAVKTTTDRVATAADEVVSEVEQVVPEVPESPAESGPGDPASADSGKTKGAKDGRRSRAERSEKPRRRTQSGPRLAEMSTTTAPAPIPDPAARVVDRPDQELFVLVPSPPQEPTPLADPLGPCAPCAHSPGAGSGGDSISIHALLEGRLRTPTVPSRGVTAARTGRPPSPSATPDVSPD